MKKNFLYAVLLAAVLLTGCRSGTEGQSGTVTETSAETAVRTETAATVSAAEETSAEATETTVSETEPEETAVRGLEPKMPEALLPAEAVKIDVEGPYGGAEYDFSYTVLDGENILIFYKFNVGRDISAKAKIFGVSDGEEKLSVDIPHTEADEFFIRDGSYFDDENILCKIFSCKIERYSCGYDYRILNTATVYDDYSVDPDDDGYGWREHIHELPGGRKITVSEYGNIREVGSGKLLLNAVYDGSDSKGNVKYRYKFAVDGNSFVYDRLGWEWIWGIGVYDFTTGEARDVPDTYGHAPMGYHNGKIYSYCSSYDDTDNIIYVTDINTLETKPLFELDENDMPDAYKMTPDGSLIIKGDNELVGDIRLNNAFNVFVYDPDTLALLRKYEFKNVYVNWWEMNIIDSGRAVLPDRKQKCLYILELDG